MGIVLIFVWVWSAMLAMSLWESSAEGRMAWDRGKIGWKLMLGTKVLLTKYHFFLFWVFLPILITLPLVIFGWDSRLFGILMSAYFSGMNVEDFGWYVFNPKVKVKEFWSDFSNYFVWVKIGNKKILPLGYFFGWAIAIAFWLIFWR